MKLWSSILRSANPVTRKLALVLWMVWIALEWSGVTEAVETDLPPQAEVDLAELPWEELFEIPMKPTRDA